MTQNEFLRNLEGALRRNGVPRIDDVLSDYREHFQMGLSNGKSEAEISQKLGDPEVIATAYKTDALIQEIKKPEADFRFSEALPILGRLIVLAPFNFFMILIPGVILLSLLFSGWVVAVTLLAGSLGVLSAGFITGVLNLSGWMMVAGVTGSLSVLALGILIGCFMFFASKHFILACISYLQWNLKFILQK